MSTSTQLRCQIPTVLYNRLLAEAKRDGVSVTFVLIDMLRKHIKQEPQPQAAKPPSQPRRAITHSERLFGIEEPNDNGFPSEDEMEQRRKALLDAFE